MTSDFLSFFSELGGAFLFVLRILRTAFTTRGNLRPILAQISQVAYRSLPTVAFAGVFVGAILVLQFNVILKSYDAQSFLGGLNTSAVIREVGPLIISFLLAGKVGAFTAAELATMRVTEQIEAIECLGTNSMQYLVLPRFVAIVISSVVLLIIGLLLSIGGSILVATLACQVNPLHFLASIPRFTSLWTLTCGVIKSAIFGVIVATVACYKGFTAQGGARGVGRAVQSAAVFTNFYIVMADFLATQGLDLIHEIGLWVFVRAGR